MNKKRYIALTLMLSLLSINKVYAACTQEEIDAFKEVEDEYKVTYELNKDTKDYTVTFYTPYIEKYTYKMGEEIKYEKIEMTTYESYSLIGVNPGTYEVEVYSIDCGDTLKTIEFNLKEYNEYSDDPLCEGIEEFYLCQPTYEKEIDRETFESRVNTYKKTKTKQEAEKNEVKEKENPILKYMQENLLQIIIITTFIILVIITTIITIISARKSRRLE